MEAIRSHAENPSAFLALNEGNEHFQVPGCAGVVSYRTAGRHLLQLGGPFAPTEARRRLLEEFLAFARERGRRVLAVQLQHADAELYAGCGFAVNQIGASYALDLTRFTLAGAKFVRLRNKISRALRTGLTVAETDPADCADDLAGIDRAWLRAKGRHAKELQFLVGAYGDAMQAHRRMFVARLDSRPIGYISYSPVFGTRSGWMHDLSRRHPDAPPGLMEAINVTAVEAFRAEDVGWLHFGFTPFTGLDPAAEVNTASPLVGRIVRLLADHGSAVYPARTQLAYKEKWAPHLVLPEYLGFQGRVRPGAVWQLLRTTNAL